MTRIIKIKHCLLADSDHSKSKRQYAHTWHKGSNIICVAKAFYTLPYRVKMGLILHELGHIYNPDITDELLVDRLATQKFGIKVKRKDFKQYGRNLETI